jgi:hypothetical protein
VTELNQAAVSLRRWMRRQLRQPTPEREHLEAAIEAGDVNEVRRLVGRSPLSDSQRRYVDSLLLEWERALAELDTETHAGDA